MSHGRTTGRISDCHWSLEMSKLKNPRSRWVKDGPTPRYDARDLVGIIKRWHEGPGWKNGARVYK